MSEIMGETHGRGGFNERGAYLVVERREWVGAASFTEDTVAHYLLEFDPDLDEVRLLKRVPGSDEAECVYSELLGGES